MHGNSQGFSSVPVKFFTPFLLFILLFTTNTNKLICYYYLLLLLSYTLTLINIMEDESDADLLALFLSCKAVEQTKFEGATNTQELFACAEELVLSQPYDVKAVKIVGNSEAVLCYI